MPASRKLYNAVAAAPVKANLAPRGGVPNASSYAAFDAALVAVADVFAADNPAFDKNRFLAAAGYVGFAPRVAA